MSNPHGTKGNTGHCIEVHDLAASKLVANREKNRVFVTTLMQEKLIDGDTLLNRVKQLPVDPGRRQSIANWIRITAEDIN